MLLSVIMPCFNEIKTIEKIVNKILKLKKIKIQIIIIDDASFDGTTEALKSKIAKKVNKVIYHRNNLGKGAAIKSSLKYIKGDLVIIQDADLEYEPSDYYKLVNQFDNSHVNVVYGSRILNRKYFIYKQGFKKNFRVFANLVLTLISNVINNQKLTDAHTCYKIFRTKLFKNLKLKEKDFAFCPEVTTKLSLLKENIIEIPIKYNGREYRDGKKINFKDALIALKTILRYKFFG